MSENEITGVQFGKLIGAMDALATTMGGIQDDIKAQRVTTQSLDLKAVEAQQTGQELKAMISGPDGASGLLGRIQSLESQVHAVAGEVADLKTASEKTRSMLIKIAITVATIGTGAAAGAPQVLQLIP